MLSKKQVQAMINQSINTLLTRDDKRCKTCGSGLIKYKESSPDGYPYYYCSKRCYRKWKKESGEIYRASPLEMVK